VVVVAVGVSNVLMAVAMVLLVFDLRPVFSSVMCCCIARMVHSTCAIRFDVVLSLCKTWSVLYLKRYWSSFHITLSVPWQATSMVPGWSIYWCTDSGSL